MYQTPLCRVAIKRLLGRLRSDMLANKRTHLLRPRSFFNSGPPPPILGAYVTSAVDDV